MAQIDDACSRLTQQAARLQGELAGRMSQVQRAFATGGGAEAELEFEGILRRLDEMNDAAGDCLAAIRDQSA